MRKMVSLGILLAISLFLVNCASAAPTQNPNNGHYYDVIITPTTITWENANLAAKYMGGHLATITSQDEDNFITGIMPSFIWGHNYWIGGYQKACAKKSDQGWAWVNCEKWNFTNWSPNEPSDGRGNENKLIFYSDTGKWNDDISKSEFAYGFIIEYDRGFK